MPDIGRRTLRAAATAAAGAVLAGCGGTAPLPDPFTVPLPRPPVLAPVSTAGGADRYRIEARPAELEILPGLRTPVLAYDGLVPGPTLEARNGRPVVVEHRNCLPVPMVVHLHGGVVPAADDGFPTDLVLPVGGAASRSAHSAHSAHPVADPDAVVTTGRREYRYPRPRRHARRPRRGGGRACASARRPGAAADGVRQGVRGRR